MKIIFLDFDGVITNLESRYCLNNEKMELVKYICDETGTKIVISSSWRVKDVETTLKSISESSRDNDPFILAEYVIGITPRFHFKYGDNYITIHRGEEIQYIIDKYKYRIYKQELTNIDRLDNYVILDDDTDMLLWQADHFIKTDPHEGITEDDVKKAISILNDKSLYIKYR